MKTVRNTNTLKLLVVDLKDKAEETMKQCTKVTTWFGVSGVYYHEYDFKIDNPKFVIACEENKFKEVHDRLKKLNLNFVIDEHNTQKK